MLQLMGYDTGIDLDRVLAAAGRLPHLIGHDVPSQILKAGRRLDLHPVPARVMEMQQQESPLKEITP
jgi:hydroxymethylglutaryl-CoA lyase